MEANVKDGKCSMCGECCTPAPMPLTKKEYATIKAYIAENKIKRTIPGQIDNNYYLTCCFRDLKNKKCNIYEVRPEICRRFQCDNGMEKIEADKLEVHKNAYYNFIDPETEEIKRITNFDQLFYGTKDTLVMYFYHSMKKEFPSSRERMEQIYYLLKKRGIK